MSLKYTIQKLGAVMALVVLLCGGVTPVHAAASVYTMTANPTYAHPVTGVIEDSGGVDSYDLGQSMTQSMLSPSAILEVDEGGNRYATVRFFMTDQISDIQFAIQDWGASDWAGTQTEITQENAGGAVSTDYRIYLSTESNVVRSTFFVGPMGRNVVFFFYFSHFTAGNNTDFIQKVSVTGEAGGDAAALTAGGGGAASAAGAATGGTASAGAAPSGAAAPAGVPAPSAAPGSTDAKGLVTGSNGLSTSGKKAQEGETAPATGYYSPGEQILINLCTGLGVGVGLLVVAGLEFYIFYRIRLNTMDDI